MHANGETLRLSPSREADWSPGILRVQDTRCRPWVGVQKQFGVSCVETLGCRPKDCRPVGKGLPKLRGEVCERGSLTADGAFLRSGGVPILRREVCKHGSLTGDGALLCDRAGVPGGPLKGLIRHFKWPYKTL